MGALGTRVLRLLQRDVHYKSQPRLIEGNGVSINTRDSLRHNSAVTHVFVNLFRLSRSTI